METYWRQDKMNGTIEEVTLKECQLAIACNFLLERDLDKGFSVHTPFSIFTNYDPRRLPVERDIVMIRRECRYCHWSKCYHDLDSGRIFCSDCGEDQN